jgi:hypothetical protein
MGEDRLTGLALMNFYPDFIPSPEALIEKFALTKARRLQLML